MMSTAPPPVCKENTLIARASTSTSLSPSRSRNWLPEMIAAMLAVSNTPALMADAAPPNICTSSSRLSEIVVLCVAVMDANAPIAPIPNGLTSRETLPWIKLVTVPEPDEAMETAAPLRPEKWLPSTSSVVSVGSDATGPPMVTSLKFAVPSDSMCTTISLLFWSANVLPVMVKEVMLTLMLSMSTADSAAAPRPSKRQSSIRLTPPSSVASNPSPVAALTLVTRTLVSTTSEQPTAPMPSSPGLSIFSRVKVTSFALSSKTASAVVFWIVPPEQLPAAASQSPPLPVTVNPPPVSPVLNREMPLMAPSQDTLWNVTPLVPMVVFAMLTPVPVAVLTVFAGPCTVIVPPAVALKPMPLPVLAI
ncbi:MAG: hypothetical protein MI923_03260 [Phycisphaerales bacterium]|nr:hypothetical protein [Phycisphaerales bacterium]